MENFNFYTPYALFIIAIILNLKIFARAEEVRTLEVQIKDLKAELMTYAGEHFVSRDTYSDNHKALQSDILQIRNDTADVKNLLISIINERNSRN